MTNPDHRYRTFCEIVLVAHHPNYLRNISDFNFIKEIGKGGYGAVWLADDMRTGNQCAVKELYVEELKGKILTSFLRLWFSFLFRYDKIRASGTAVSVCLTNGGELFLLGISSGQERTG